MEITSVKEMPSIKSEAKDKNSKLTGEDGFSQMIAALFGNIQNAVNFLNTSDKTTESNDNSKTSQVDALGNLDNLMSVLKELNFSANSSTKTGNEDELNKLIEQLESNQGKATGKSELNINNITNILKVQDSKNGNLNNGEIPVDLLKILKDVPDKDFSKYFNENKNDIVKDLSSSDSKLITDVINKLSEEAGTQKNLIQEASVLKTGTDQSSNGIEKNSYTKEIKKSSDEKTVDLNLPGVKNESTENKNNVPKSVNVSKADDNIKDRTVKNKEIKTEPKIEVKSTNIKDIKSDTLLSTQTEPIKTGLANDKIEAKEIANVVKPEDLVDIAVNKFKALRLPEVTELKVKLRPEELGDITVKVVLERGQINGNITAESKDVVNMIQGQMDNLKEGLKNNNVNLNNLSVNLSNDDNLGNRQGSGQYSGEQRKHNRNFDDYVIDDIDDNDSDQGFNIIA